MKVLLLHYGGAFTAPLLRSVEAFRDNEVELQAEEATEWATCRFDIYDAVLLEEPMSEAMALDERILHLRGAPPIVLLERIDGAQIRAARELLPQVAGVIKGYAFRDRTLYNRTNDRRHVEILHEAGVECEHPRHLDDRPEPQLTDADLAKIRVGYSMFGCHGNLQTLVDAQIDFDAERTVDVHFAGTVEYRGSEVEAHRKLCLEAVRAYPGPQVASEGLAIPYDKYLRQLQQSKCVVCPWGWGEGTHREYEAWLAGAVVIKPDTKYVETFPDVYRGAMSIWCKPDFSDLHEIVDRVRENWTDHTEDREIAQSVIASAWEPGSIATRMIGQIRELIA